MDLDAEIQELEDRLLWIEQYLNHPLTQAFEDTSKTAEETLITIICHDTIMNIETFFAHFEAVGHLKGLRRSRALVRSEYDEVKKNLKEKKDERDARRTD